jgi:hypothetical protein
MCINVLQIHYTGPNFISCFWSPAGFQFQKFDRQSEILVAKDIHFWGGDIDTILAHYVNYLNNSTSNHKYNVENC